MPRRSDLERLRAVLGLTLRVRDSSGRIISAPIYTQKELAKKIGVSERTLRRYKNIPGYKPSDKTIKRISRKLTFLESEARRYILRKYKLPAFPIVQIPIEFRSKATGKRTLDFQTSHWSLSDRLRFLDHALRSDRFIGWRAVVEVPPGVSLSNRYGEGELNSKDVPVNYVIGPFPFEQDFADIVRFHEDAGRRVVRIMLIER